MQGVTRRLRVLLLARYGPLGASSRVRHYSYLASLARRGIDVEVDHLIDDASLARFYAGRMRRWDKIGFAYVRRLARLQQLRHDAFDLIWIEKEALPGLPWAIERLFYGQAPTVVDLDDFWVARFDGAPSDDKPTREALKFRALLQAATRVTAANGHLADAIAEFSGRSPQILESAIDVDQYQQARDRSEMGRPADQLCRIGWIGTPYTANAYLPALVPILNRLSERRISVTRLVGAGAAVPELKAERVAWTLASEADAVAGIDVGVMPLDATAFAAGKSGWKLVQSMAAGCPVVATRVGFNVDLVEDGVTGFLVDRPEDFEAPLRLLAGDRTRRMAMGAAAQAFVRRRFDRRGRADALADILLTAARAFSTKVDTGLV